MIKIKKIVKDVFFVAKLTTIKRKKIRILLSAVISNSISFADILIILTFSQILTDSETITNKYIDLLSENPISIIFVVLLRFILNFIGKYNIFSLTKDIEKSLKVYLLKEVYKRGNYSVADATYYIESLSGHISYFFNSFSNIMSSGIQVIIFISFLTYDSFEVLSTFGILLIVLYYPTKWLLSKGRIAMEDSFAYSQFSVRYIQRIIDNLFLVKILNTEKFEVLNFENNITNLNNTERKRFVISDINTTIPNFIAIFSFSLILALGADRLTLTLEFIGITLRLMQSVGSMNSALSMLISTHVHLDVLVLIKENSNFDSDFNYKIDKNSKSAIKMKNVSFKFMNNENFFYEDLNLDFERNKHYVITGENGSGKSTLLGILTGALNPTSGSAIKSSDKFGYIGASPLILEDTLRENLKYASKKDISDLKMLEYLDEFKVFTESSIEDLDKIISNKTLSSGQMQKISFIRAFLSSCEILFLDESTSNLDIGTKKQISDILNSKEITIINSTHNAEDFNFDAHYKIVIDKDDRRLIQPLNI